MKYLIAITTFIIIPVNTGHAQRNTVKVEKYISLFYNCPSSFDVITCDFPINADSTLMGRKSDAYPNQKSAVMTANSYIQINHLQIKKIILAEIGRSKLLKKKQLQKSEIIRNQK